VIADKEEKKVSENNESEEKRDENEQAESSSTKKESNLEATTSNTANAKTAMCLVHELAKYNKIKHEYVLLDEIGPAHKKKFYVALKLGVGTEHEETFSSNGSSIKKAQHAAAEIALKDTKFKRPESKTNRINAKLFNRASNKIDTKEVSENATGLSNTNNAAKHKSISSKKQSNLTS
jgi:double-stranded RNA-binding protein Staufen